MYLRIADALLSASADSISRKRIILVTATIIALAAAGFVAPLASGKDFSNARATYASPAPDLNRLNFADMREIEATRLGGPRDLTDCYTCRDSQTVRPIAAPKPVKVTLPPPTPAKSVRPAVKPSRKKAIKKARKRRRPGKRPRVAKRRVRVRKKHKKKVLTGTVVKKERAVPAPVPAPPRPTTTVIRTPSGGTPVPNSLGMSPLTYALFQSSRMLRKGRFYCASLRAREALFLDPSNQQARTLLNTSLHTVGIHPSLASDRLALANHFARQNMILPAIIEYRESIALNPTAEAYAGLGELLRFAGQEDRAREMFEEALALNPNYYAASNGLLELARLQTQPVSGINTSQTVRETPFPHDPTVPPMVIPVNISSLQQNTAQSAGVKAESMLAPAADLFNITPYGSNIVTRIALRNQYRHPLALPDKADVIVTSPDGTARRIPIYFQSASVPPAGRAFGTFVTPGFSIPPGSQISLASWLPGKEATNIPVRPPQAYDINSKLASIKSTSCSCK